MDEATKRKFNENIRASSRERMEVLEIAVP